MIPALFFSVDVKHAHDLADAMQAHGVNVKAISGKTPDTELRRINAAFRSGEIDGLSSCQMFLEAADYPTAMAAMMCRPTQSGLMYRQMIGRVLRPFPAPQGTRPYQQAALNAVLREARAGVMDQLVVLPTGTGKTHCAAKMPKLAEYWKGGRKRGRMLFLVHMDILAEQTVDKMREINPDLKVGLEKAGSYAGDADIVVGSIQTLGPPPKNPSGWEDGFGSRLRYFRPEQFDVIVYDEVHRLVGSKYGQNVLRYFHALKEEPDNRDPEILSVGITATPTRSDNIGLEKFYSKITYQYGIRQAIEEKWLAPIVAHRCETEFNLDGIKKNKEGDFAEHALANTVNTPERNELVAQKYLEVCRLEGMEGPFFKDGWVKPHAVVVDFVDVCSKHQLILAPTLFGLRAKFNPKGKDLIKQVEEVEEAERKHPTLDLRSAPDMEHIRASLQNVDLLAPPTVPEEIRRVSKFAWLQNGSGYHLGRLDHTLLSIRQNALGEYEVATHTCGVRAVIGTERDLKAALKVAEGTMPEADQRVLRATASWREDPPSVPQCTRVWQLDPKVRERYPNPGAYGMFCLGQFGSGNMGYNKGGLSLRIQLLESGRA